MKYTIENLNKLHIAEFEKALYNINMSTRKIKKSYISCTGYFASCKNKTQVAFESVLERDFFMLLEFDDNVVSYEEQPVTINYEYLDGSLRKYTPDCLVTYKDKRKQYFEVKYNSDIISDDELQEKLEFLKLYFPSTYDLNLQIITDTDMDKVYLDNLKFLYKFAFIPENQFMQEKINHILNCTDGIQVCKMLEILDSNKMKQLEWLPYVWKNVFQNTSIVNLNKKLTMTTILEKKVMF